MSEAKIYLGNLSYDTGERWVDIWSVENKSYVSTALSRAQQQGHELFLVNFTKKR